MFKKFLIGLAMVAVVCALARAGYEFGQHLAQRDQAKVAAAAAQP
ncbi:hypothetical protein [Lysobacter sp. cf310]|nr:hypothetical protein [Lysobacter sp. cf310]SFK94880.1 hypothetical protein SAMN04487938_2581 [Lysobacter sp. cf310]